ncbi:MAG TPA: ACP S-malonyltransferase [Solirubrobacterales bacterium]|jgi:malonyl CoA-acyl carrier protein transacylase|nr:ACP S-malonyltransferase [Solirubrobacterales bacterium]
MAAVSVEQRPDLVEQAREELGADPFEQIGEGTHLAQPALFIAGLAHWKAADEPRAGFYAGHSLGELPALVAAGALDAAAGLRLAIVRGRLMEEASAVRPGGMVAALGGSDEVVRAVAERFDLTLANDNAPGQMVLSGEAERVGEARKALRAEGAKAIRLPVAGAFHSPLMEPAIPGYREILEATEFAPTPGAFSCVTAAPFDDVRADLLAALTEPVRWRETLAAMRTAGADAFLETGPGDILTGLSRRTLGEEVESRTLDPAKAAAGA